MDDGSRSRPTARPEDKQARLARILRVDPRNVEAWLLLAETLDDPARRRECYARVLALDPDNQVARQYLSLPSAPAAPPIANPPAPAGQRGPGRALVLLLLVIVALVACWAIATGSPGGSSSRATGAAPGTIAASEPALLSGLTQGDLKVYFEDRHFTCSDLQPGGQHFIRSCTRDTGPAVYQVTISSRGFAGVDVIDATILQYGAPDDGLAAEFLGTVAAFPYNRAEPDRARAWVAAELPGLRPDEVRSATFGGVPFELSGKPAARTLTMGRLAE